ncbi:MAG: transposase [Gemmatimonadaceae bacterium]
MLGDRKSVEPLASRIAPADYAQVHHFVCASCWAPAPLERVLVAKAQAMVGGNPGRDHLRCPHRHAEGESLREASQPAG